MMTSMDSNGVSRLPGGFGKLRSGSPFSSISSLNHHLRLSQHRKAAGEVTYRSHVDHDRRSLPLLQLQPPLLPLPPPSTSKAGEKISNAMRTREQKKRRKPAASSKREPPGWSRSVATTVDDVVSQPNNAGKNREEEEEEAVISPPPSSLPLPSLALVRLRTGGVVSRGGGSGGDGCCGGGGGAKAMLKAGGATDELRRLLRI